MKFSVGAGALLAATIVVTAGCSASIAGSPRPGLTPVDVATLKTGGYTPEPLEFEPDLSTPADLYLIESRRMLGYLVHPADIDKELSVAGNVRFFSHPEAPFTYELLPDKYRPATVDNNLLAGVYVSRINDNLRSRKKLIVSVLRYSTDAVATKAAEDFERITYEEAGRHAIPIAGNPAARASSADDVTAVSFIARGPFVVITNAGVPQPDQSALARVIEATIDRQFTLLDQLKPTPWDDILDIPLDPDGIMRRALPKAPDYSDPFVFDQDFGAHSPAGELHFERNPVEVKKAFEESGVDLVGRRGGIVYRTRDLPAAFRLQSALVIAGKNDEVLDPPPGLPDVRCLRLDSADLVRSFDGLCAVVYGRYVAVVMSKSPMTSRIDHPLYQRAAAQYAILAKSE
ncbi:hypothetical protein [Nocardia sp. NPDC005366]|uniref:DUF7373 family lipoprotein n=1 Tax=Nocardia sp. NPDC005366 TaxID=3156878 RepID=UPI0033A665FE